MTLYQKLCKYFCDSVGVCRDIHQLLIFGQELDLVNYLESYLDGKRELLVLSGYEAGCALVRCVSVFSLTFHRFSKGHIGL